MHTCVCTEHAYTEGNIQQYDGDCDHRHNRTNILYETFCMTGSTYTHTKRQSYNKN